MALYRFRGAAGDRLVRGSARKGVAVLVVASLLPFAGGCSGPSKDAGRAEGRPELALGRSAAYDYDPPEPGTYTLPAMMAAADGRVVDGDGNERSLREALAGRITVLSFIYTRCADPTACPVATGVLRQLHGVSKEAPEVAANLRLVTFSFDPEYDDPERMARFATSQGAAGEGAEWLFLTTSGPASLRPILAAYGQRVDRKSDPADPLGPLSHNMRVFLIDRRGQVRNIYSSGLMDPRLVMADVRTLILEERG